MKVSEALARVKEVKPNPFTDEMLLNWLNDFEAKVQTETRVKAPQGVDIYTLPEDLNTELLLARPYDECYPLYIQAQIDFALQEFDTYNNSMRMFNTSFEEAKRYYVRHMKEQEPLKLKTYL